MSDKTTDALTIELPNDDAHRLKSEFDSHDLSARVFVTRRLSGLEDIATVVVPVTIGAIQVASAFLIAWLQQRKRSKSTDSVSLRVLVNDISIEATNLTPEHVEKLIGKVIDNSAAKRDDATPSDD